jgi:hypothetical protein
VTEDQAAPRPRNPGGRPSLGPRTQAKLAIPVEEWPLYQDLVGGPLGKTRQDVLLRLIRLGYVAYRAGLTIQETR